MGALFRLHTSRMSLNDDVDLEEFIMTKDDLSGADIKAVCTEAGLLALRERRMRVTKADFTTAREKVYITTILLIMQYQLIEFSGSIQEERRHTGGSVPVVYIIVFAILRLFSFNVVALIHV